jgi:hypothetical protein
MDGMMLLEEARAAGLIVLAEGGRLRIRGPRRAEPIAQRLIAHKDAVLGALAAQQSPARGVRVEDLDPDWRVEWEERAAIMEFEGGAPRERAEAAALAEIIKKMRAVGCDDACVKPK